MIAELFVAPDIRGTRPDRQFLEHLESGSAVIIGAAGVDISKDHKEVLTCPTPRPRLALS